jgi:hypothetical protein
MYTWLPLSSASDLTKLESHISAEYGAKAVAKKLVDGISDAVKAVLIEYNYIDKDYRSAFLQLLRQEGPAVSERLRAAALL